MGGAAASRIPPAWGFTREEAFELAGGSKPGSHWDEEQWEKLKNDEGLITPKLWKAEVARVNQEVMDEMLRQQAETARKAAVARAAAEERKRKAEEAAKAAEEEEQRRLQVSCRCTSVMATRFGSCKRVAVVTRTVPLRPRCHSVCV